MCTGNKVEVNGEKGKGKSQKPAAGKSWLATSCTCIMIAVLAAVSVPVVNVLAPTFTMMILGHAVSTSATSFTYRVGTMADAFWKLYTAKPEDLEPFFKSFEIWDRKAYNTLEDFKAGIPPEPFITGKADAAKVVDYYGTLNKLCAMGSVEKMYIPPHVDKTKGVFDNQLLWEKSFIDMLMAGPLPINESSKILEVGCGRGRITYHTQQQTGAHVTGINIEPDQLKAARAFAEQQGLLGTRLEFLEGNYNDDMPFPDNTFDAFYAVQPLTYSQDLYKNFREFARVMKPGARLSILDGAMRDGFDPTQERHRRLLLETREVTGLGGFWHTAYWRDAIEKAGMEVIFEEVVGDLQAPLIEEQRWLFEGLGVLVEYLCKFGILPDHFHRLLQRFSLHGTSFIAMDKERMFTTAYQVVAQKKMP
mmetsp:Transcript_54052/g.136545  ORF Transcript_54052/g.136545 Transcript_54052/m.136545 type:complete len:420 (-) Transcript_54052:250-1509(-)